MEEGDTKEKQGRSEEEMRRNGEEMAKWRRNGEEENEWRSGAEKEEQCGRNEKRLKGKAKKWRRHEGEMAKKIGKTSLVRQDQCLYVNLSIFNSEFITYSLLIQ